ncbi:MAG: hypothetical protein IJC27_10255 [Lentisphaeria bacterium]|nr:hypothetical protein [Lentisphaeria bacterium]
MFDKIKNFFHNCYLKLCDFRELSPEKYVKSFVIILLVLIVFAVAAVLLVDPYVRYHKAVGIKQIFRKSEAMIPGIMRNFDYDTVLFGSSMTQNFDIAEMNAILGGKSIKATCAGLDSESLDKYLETAFAVHKKDLKRCLVGVDLFCFSPSDRPRWKDYKYMYGDHIFAPEYFFSTDTADAIRDMIKTNITQKWKPISRFELDSNKMFSNKPGLKYGRKYLEYAVTQLHPFPVPLDETTIANFERHFFRHIAANPDVQFDVFMPPYSIYFWCYIDENKELDKLSDLRNRFAEGVLKYPNVRLFDFHADFDICCNLDNYKDVTHYSPEINTLLLKKIASDIPVKSYAGFVKNTNAICEKLKEYKAEFARLRSLDVGPKKRRAVEE